MRLGGGIGYVDRLVGNCAIFFFFGFFWLPPAEGCLYDSKVHSIGKV
jgi:hypothetical protein